MTTELQVRANQRNAEQSSGPKTEAGKRRVALNGITHGLTARPVVLHDEDAQAFEQMRFNLLRAYKPVGDVELLYADRAAVALWRLHRVLALEGRLLLARQSAEDDETSAQTFQRDLDLVTKGLPGLSRYERDLERTFTQSIALLRQEQEVRAMREVQQRGGQINRILYRPSPGPWAEVASLASVTSAAPVSPTPTPPTLPSSGQ